MGDIDLVSGDRLEALRSLLARDPAQNLLALALLEDYGLGRADAPTMAFYARREGEALTACVFVGGGGELVIPFAPDASSAAELGNFLSQQRIAVKGAVGERGAVDALMRAMGAFRARVDRPQRLFTVSADDLGPFVAPQLRLAQESDLPELVELADRAVRETLGTSPLEREGETFRRRVAARTRAGRTWVMRIDDRLCFKVDMGARCRYGAELEGIFMLPETRRKGLSTLALGQICRQQLSAIPRLTLRVDEGDEAAARLCRKVGFVAAKAQRMLLME